MARGVIFDMDGVLVDSGPPHHESWRLLAARHGIDVTPERFRQSFGQRSCDIIRLLWGPQTTDAEVRRLDDEKEELYRDLIRGRVPLMPGCRAALATLQAAGLRLAVGTSGPPENLALVLREGELETYFDAIVNGSDIRHGKPAPDCFLLAAERLGLPPRECVVIEDAPVGVRAGVAAGMFVIGLTGTTDAAALQAAGARQVVERLTEITPALIKQVSAQG